MEDKNIKRAAQILENIDELKDYKNKGFLHVIEHFGTSPNANEFEVKPNFHLGSGVLYSVNYYMYPAFVAAKEAFEATLQSFANHTIRTLEAELKDIKK